MADVVVSSIYSFSMYSKDHTHMPWPKLISRLMYLLAALDFFLGGNTQTVNIRACIKCRDSDSSHARTVSPLIHSIVSNDSIS